MSFSNSVERSFAERVRRNQERLRSALKPQCDFIVCGSGSSGSVVARRLAENREVNVLLLEAGGDDDVPDVIEANRWPANLGSERDWSFEGQPNAHVNGRSIPFSMGKLQGGGSSINAMAWARGHRTDWDFFASEANDPAWSYESVLNIYRASKTGMARRTQRIAEREGLYLCSPRPIRTRLLSPPWKQRVQPACLSLRVRTVT